MGKKKFAVFSTGWGSEILQQYIEGIREGLRDISADLYLFLCYATFGQEEGFFQGELNIFNLPDMHDFDGAFVFANGIDFKDVTERINERCDQAGIPVIYTGKDDGRHYLVGCDNLFGMRAMCEHLIDEHGVRNPAFVAGSRDNMDSNDRLHTLMQVLEERNLTLPEEHICYSYWNPMIADDFFTALYEAAEPMPDAILCANDTLAMLLCHAATEKGIRVPQDMVIAGFDHSYNSQIYDPSICSVDQRFEEIGRKCAEVMEKILNHEPCERVYQVRSEFVPSESCGCGTSRDVDKVRREIGRKRFIDNMTNSNFDIKLSDIERRIATSKCYKELGEQFSRITMRNKDFEGTCFHFVMDPLFEQSIYDQTINMKTDGYSEIMDVVYSKDGTSIHVNEKFNHNVLVPFYSPSEENRFFIFLPLHESVAAFGYLVFGDDCKKINQSQNLRIYVQRMSILLGKFYRELRMNELNCRLRLLSETDALTQLKNRMAFETKEAWMQDRINAGCCPACGVVMVDINNLKKINDRYGHEFGDLYIQNSCKLLSETFCNSVVYRIGGDEFIVVLEEEDYQRREQCLQSIDQKIEELADSDLPAYEKVSIACGLAIYDSAVDKRFSDICNRADAAMYVRKTKMKAEANEKGKHDRKTGKQ